MIKINRDNYPPSDSYVTGSNKGIQKWRIYEKKVYNDFKKNATAFINGTYNFSTHPSYDLWKSSLTKLQGKKCCYCEKPIDKGDLEHFRPKKGWKQSNGLKINRPGYYWLAYRWRNLLLSCKICNSSARKGNLFPISGVRATTPICNIHNENSNLINPYEDNVDNEISFYKSTPISKGTKGATTINILDLQNRSDIKQIREDKWTMYYYTSIISKKTPNDIISQLDINQASEKIRIAKKNKQPFSGMIIANINNGTFK